MSSVMEPVSPEIVSFLAQYLKLQNVGETSSNLCSVLRPFVTLSYAASLDSHISLEPGMQTILSGKKSKSLTHYLRRRHEAILVGAGTAAVDDPGLNSKIVLPDESGIEYQPRPIIVDPGFRWNINRDSRILRTAREGKGLAPWILVDEEFLKLEMLEERIKVLEDHGGRIIAIPKSARIPHSSLGRERGWVWDWRCLFEVIYASGISSLMIEGGSRVINDLLSKQEYLKLIDSVVITIAPVYLGRNGVNVSPEEKREEQGDNGKCGKIPAVRFKDIKWCPLEDDVIMAARPLA